MNHSTLTDREVEAIIARVDRAKVRLLAMRLLAAFLGGVWVASWLFGHERA